MSNLKSTISSSKYPDILTDDAEATTQVSYLYGKGKSQGTGQVRLEYHLYVEQLFVPFCYLF